MVLNVILSLSFRHYLRPDADCWPLSTESNTRWPKITDSRARCYCSLKLGDFVLEIAPNRCPKFGSAQKMLYLCTRKQEVLGEPSGKPSGEYEWRLRLSIARASSALHSPCTSLVIVNRWSSESHESSLSNGRVATEKDAVNHERQQSGKRRADVDRRKLSLIPCKNTFKHYGKDFVWSKTEPELV